MLDEKSFEEAEGFSIEKDLEMEKPKDVKFYRSFTITFDQIREWWKRIFG